MQQGGKHSKSEETLCRASLIFALQVELSIAMKTVSCVILSKIDLAGVGVYPK